MFDVRSRQYAQFRKWERKLNISSVMNIICNTIDRELENRREKTEKQFSLFEKKQNTNATIICLLSSFINGLKYLCVTCTNRRA